MADLAPELARLVAAAAADPMPGGPGAAERRRAVLALRARGELANAADRCAAANLLVDSDDVAEVTAAHELALAAMAGERRARLVAATAYDRLRRLAGAPQKFGTQLVGAAGCELWPVDPTTTDSERAKWDVPPLAELQRRARGGA